MTMDVVVLMPSIDEDASMESIQRLKKRAGMDADFIVAVDQERNGFIKTVNDYMKNDTHKYCVYLAQDAFGGKNWLKLAYDELESTGKNLFAFNDGKWYGRIAAFGMVRTSWKSPFFHGEYKKHYADLELTLQAMSEDSLTTDLRSILIELDVSDKQTNIDDRQLFAARKDSLFDETVRKDVTDIYE